MRAALPWIAAYAAILLVWALVILGRRGPTLWKGRSLVALNSAFAIVSTAVILARGQSPGAGLIAFDLVLILVALVVRDKWLLLGISHADSAAVLEKCFAQTRSSSTRRGDGYVINCGGAVMIVKIRPSISQLLGVSFTGATGSRKAKLVQKTRLQAVSQLLPHATVSCLSAPIAARGPQLRLTFGYVASTT